MSATANDMPNYRHGIKNAVWSVRSVSSGGAVSYGSIKHEPGAESVEPSAPSQNSTTFFSDDGKPATVNGAIGNTTLNVQFAEFSNDYQTDVLNHKIDSTTGAVIKSRDDEAKAIAFGYEVQGTLKGTRVWWSNCQSSEPTASAHQTNGENVTEAPDSATLTVNGEKYGDCMVCHEGDTGYATFLDSVPAAFYTAPVSGGQTPQ